MQTLGESEVELKLELLPESLAEVLASPLFAGQPDLVHQQATYYDTADHRLAALGLSLRVRIEDGRHVQTIKVEGGPAAGLFVRDEWVRILPDGQPLLDAAVALAPDCGPIGPVFTITLIRRRWRSRGVEMALDCGHVRAGEGEAPFCEVELESSGADPSVLFALAREMIAALPARIGVLTKAERGYRLLDGAPRAARAGRAPVRPGMTTADTFARIAAACLRQFRLNEALIAASHDAQAIHQARVALRRLRSAFAVFKPMLDEETGALNSELRWLAAELAAARECDVLIARAPPDPVPDRLLAERLAGYERAVGALDSLRARMLMLDIAAWLRLGSWRSSSETRTIREMPVEAYAARALDRWRRRVRREGRALADLDDADRHGVRRSVKKLRYAVDFFAPLFRGRHERRRRRRFVAALENLQDELGTLNDLATAPLLLARLGLEESPLARQFGDLGTRPRHLAAAVASYDALFDIKPFWR